MKELQKIIRKNRPDGPILKQCKGDFGMEYLTFPTLEDTGIVEHLFTTRLGGVSEGVLGTMNLSFQRGDDESNVLENYRRVAKALHCWPDDIVCSHQTHTTNIRKVTAADRGKGVIRPRDYSDIDGLITDEQGIALATFFADCVPLYFVDKTHKAIGLAHSGWRGTVSKMGAAMCRRMEEEYGTRPKDLIAAIGPSICVNCYEVSEDVAELFFQMLQKMELSDERKKDVVKTGKAAGKYLLDLWLANELILLEAGVPKKQIFVTDICTCQNPEYLFSHRASQGRRGNLGAFLMLK